MGEVIQGVGMALFIGGDQIIYTIHDLDLSEGAKLKGNILRKHKKWNDASKDVNARSKSFQKEFLFVRAKFYQEIY